MWVFAFQQFPVSGYLNTKSYFDTERLCITEGGGPSHTPGVPEITLHLPNATLVASHVCTVPLLPLWDPPLQ